MSNKLKSIFKMNTIKKKMIFYYMMMIIFMSIISIYSINITNEYKEQIEGMFVRNIILKNISDQISLVDKELVGYLSTKSSTSLNNYMRDADELENISDELSTQVNNYTEEELMFLDIENMIDSYIVQTEKAVSQKRKTDVVGYTQTYNKSLDIMNYIMNYISELNSIQLNRNATNYIYMSKQIKTANLLNVVLIIDLILLSIIIVYKMTNHMIKPLINLSHSAEDISKGNFETIEVLVETNDEIEILSKAFNEMKRSIHAYIEELKEKALTEAKLKDQQLENLKMQSLLDKARLYAYQAQMNPHFLFNTINAAVQLTTIEGADRSSEFLERMSRVYRYNIKQIDSEVTVSQEIENIRDYGEVLKVRFGDLIKFTFKIDESALLYRMPPLIIQPIVENAYIHGLSKKEGGGNIIVKVTNQADTVIIVVEDDGVGMSHEMIDKFINNKSSNLKDKEIIHKSINKSPNIGIRNVTNRLELFFKQKNLVDIKSEKGVGTRISILIPHYKGDI